MKFSLIALTVAAMIMSVAPLALADGTGEGLDMEKARATFERRCSVCHSIDRPLGKNKDRDGWEATVKRMAGKLAFPVQEQEMIIDYLAAERGPVE